MEKHPVGDRCGPLQIVDQQFLRRFLKFQIDHIHPGDVRESFRAQQRVDARRLLPETGKRQRFRRERVAQHAVDGPALGLAQGRPPAAEHGEHVLFRQRRSLEDNGILHDGGEKRQAQRRALTPEEQEPARIGFALQCHAAAGQDGDDPPLFGPAGAQQFAQAEEMHGLHHFGEAVDAVQVGGEHGGGAGEPPLKRPARGLTKRTRGKTSHAPDRGWRGRARGVEGRRLAQGKALPRRKAARKGGKGFPHRLKKRLQQGFVHAVVPFRAPSPESRKSSVSTAKTTAMPTRPEAAPQRAMTCPSVTGPSIWPRRSVTL